MKKLTVTIKNGKSLEVEYGTRLSDILNIEKPCGGHGICGKCKVIVDGREEFACEYTVTSDITVEIPAKSEIVSEVGETSYGHITDNLCFVLDVGTTTIALALVSLDDKKIIEVKTATNSQRTYGADVITRIEYCQKHSVSALHNTLVQDINRMINSFGDIEVSTLWVSANVTMLHTLFGEDCSSIGVAPYTPGFLEAREEKAVDLGIEKVEKVISLPSISSFVGADIVSGINLIGFPEDGKYNLLIDLGTNAEVVLYSNSSGVATAAAAGPAFEGANISCGMSAVRGAIYSAEAYNGRLYPKTIGNEKPLGICGTGLIDIISELLKLGDIDETGYIDSDYKIADGVYLTGKDVRQYQLAKSAVYSAILSLMKNKGVAFDDISNMYISGGFSSKINIDNAVYSGLLPKELKNKAISVNNSSLLGTVRYVCEGGELNKIIDTVKYVDLSSTPYFSELFIDNMIFD